MSVQATRARRVVTVLCKLKQGALSKRCGSVCLPQQILSHNGGLSCPTRTVAPIPIPLSPPIAAAPKYCDRLLYS